jgi:hypothetical protein
MEQDLKASWWTTLPGVLTAIAGFITAICTLIAALQGIGLLSDAKDANKPEIKSDSAPPPPALPFNRASKPQPDVQPDLVAEAPGTYRGAIHGLVILSDGSRQQLDMPATMTILAPVKQGGRFESSLTLPPYSMGAAPKTFFMQGTISGDRITFDDYQVRFVGRYNGSLISGNLSETTKVADPPNLAARGIQRIQLVGMDLFKD